MDLNAKKRQGTEENGLVSTSGGCLGSLENSDDVICCDENVMVLCSERVKTDQNGPTCSICKWLTNQVKERIFITVQNTLGDLQNRGARHHWLESAYLRGRRRSSALTSFG
jgi:hypothetical protein